MRFLIGGLVALRVVLQAQLWSGNGGLPAVWQHTLKAGDKECNRVTWHRRATPRGKPQRSWRGDGICLWPPTTYPRACACGSTPDFTVPGNSTRFDIYLVKG